MEKFGSKIYFVLIKLYLLFSLNVKLLKIDF